MSRESRRKFRAALLIAAGSLCMVGNRGCEANLAARCEEDFAGLRAEVASRLEMTSGRSLASVSEDEIAQCSRWARRRLEEVQWMLDVAMREPGRREASIDLNQIATHLVMLHGSCESGDRAGTRQQLAYLEKSLPIAQEKACAASRAPAARDNP